MNLTNNDEQTWLFLRERSLQPGGFGEDRTRIWPALLGAQPLSDPPPYSEVESASEYENPIEESLDESIAEPHADERQIKLDTDRSFVLYPGESGTTHPRDALQNDLHELLVSLFRKRRSLHYFQGFHDIMTVIFLTLPRPLHLACAEKMALHRVRDAMGVGLEPVLGLLRVLRNLLRLVDPTYAKLLEDTSPLPYHALSHLLTLFSHDVPTLPLIQHVWDFLLAREPIAVVWLAAALILHRKPSIYLLAEQDEDGMIHSLLGGIPELVDADPEFYDMGNYDVAQDTTTRADYAAENVRPSRRSTASIAHEQPDSEVVDGMVGPPDISEQMDSSHDTSIPDEDEFHQTSVTSNVVQTGNLNTLRTNFFPLQNTTDGDHVGSPLSSTLDFIASIPLPDSQPASPSVLPEPSFSVPLPQEARSTSHHSRSPSPSISDHVPSRSRSISGPTQRSPSDQPCGVVNEAAAHVDTFVRTRTKPPPLSLTRLLRQADDLLNAYPPSHPSVRLTEIMGPDSAMRMWCPSPITTTRDAVPEKLPYDETDDYLETLVDSSHIVIPSPPPSPPLGPRLVAKKTKISLRASSKALLDPRRIGQRLGALTAAERRILFMGALLVVGAAVALKSSKVPYVDSIVKASGGDGLKRLWNGKWTIISSMVAAWGRGLP